eukprot:1205152-Prymnesium_polylepis.1
MAIRRCADATRSLDGKAAGVAVRYGPRGGPCTGGLHRARAGWLGVGAWPHGAAPARDTSVLGTRGLQIRQNAM